MTRPKCSGSRSARGSRAAGPTRERKLRAAGAATAARLRRCLAAGLIGLGVAMAAPGVRAASDPLPSATAAVIDYQRVMREAKAAESIRVQIESRRLRYQSEIAEEEQRLVEADRELARQRSILSTEAFTERRRTFEEDVAEVQRMLQTRRQQLDDVAAMAMAEVREAVIQVVGELAEQRGFNLVLPSANVLLFSPQIDITDEVLDKLDANLPDVRVPESAAGRG